MVEGEQEGVRGEAAECGEEGRPLPGPRGPHSPGLGLLWASLARATSSPLRAQGSSLRSSWRTIRGREAESPARGRRASEGPAPAHGSQRPDRRTVRVRARGRALSPGPEGTLGRGRGAAQRPLGGEGVPAGGPAWQRLSFPRGTQGLTQRGHEGEVLQHHLAVQGPLG